MPWNNDLIFLFLPSFDINHINIGSHKNVFANTGIISFFRVPQKPNILGPLRWFNSKQPTFYWGVKSHFTKLQQKSTKHQSTCSTLSQYNFKCTMIFQILWQQYWQDILLEAYMAALAELIFSSILYYVKYFDHCIETRLF